MSKVFKVLFVLLLIEVAYIAGSLTPMLMDKSQPLAQKICDYSNGVKEYPNDWEEACGMAQDVTNTEYTCYKDNTCRLMSKD